MSSARHCQDREALLARYGERYRWLVLAAVSVGLVAGILPSSSFVVAIPSLLETFHAGHSQGQLVMTSFMVTNTIAMLPTPWLIERFGMRRCFFWAVGLLTVTSILGALSPSFGFLVFIRAVQGIGAGVIMPMTSIVIMRLFEPEHQGRAAGFMGLSVTLAPALAPTIGGLMVDWWGWRSVSLMPLPFCLVAWLAALRFLPMSDKTERHSFDTVGMVLLSLLTLSWLGVASNIVAQGAARAWLLGSLAILLASGVAFVAHARRIAHPLISLDVLQRRRVTMGAVISFVLGFSVYGSAYLVPVYFQVALGLSATRAGAALMPGTLALGLSFPIAGFLLGVFSPRQVMVAGTLAFAVGWLVLGGFSAQLSYGAFVVVLMCSRVGHGFASTPLTQAALVGLHDAALSQASAVLGYVRQLGGVLGIALLAVFVDWRSTSLGGAEASGVQVYAEAFIIVALVSAASILAIWQLRDASASVGPRGMSNQDGY